MTGLVATNVGDVGDAETVPIEAGAAPAGVAVGSMATAPTPQAATTTPAVARDASLAIGPIASPPYLTTAPKRKSVSGIVGIEIGCE